MACCIREKEWTGITVASFPPATMYSPVGSMSTPWGDFGRREEVHGPLELGGLEHPHARCSVEVARPTPGSYRLWK
jgi:hypothetical protein